jgi:serine/threonine protein kinase
MPISSEEGFPGTDRFSVVRRLGAGAYGVVYEAFDREHDATVALKTLRPGNVEALYRLKREFRALADIRHHNLASLYEMLSEGELWFITMELVDGANFLQHVRPGPAPPAAAVGGLASTLSESPSDPTALATSPSRAFGAASEPQLLREALRQAVSGISALHEAGKLHRDIKPSNVLVTRNGRVVLLDFGLVAEMEVPGTDGSMSIVGTPAYMSPEQGSRLPVSEKSDWYSLGVMLYEALTGRHPFAGSFADMMWEKRSTEPPAPRTVLAGIPDDLNELCTDLLRRDPQKRPSGAEILRRLGGGARAAVPRSAAAPVSSRPAPFVGRETHLAALREAFEGSRQGRAVTVYLHGTSGIGKTALVRRFLDTLRRDDVVILSGRCYERESMPYKALDSLIDSLSQYLKRLPVDRAEALLPRDILALARVFPVLRRVEAVAGTRRKVFEIPDSLELRRRAFAALRELLAKLAGQTDVVLFIDDLQWGDADSAALLAELMRAPDPPALLLIACYRSEEADTSPLLQKLLPRHSAAGSPDNQQLAVGELATSEACDLALMLLGGHPTAARSQAEAIARDSAGNPFFIHELVRFGQAGAERSRASAAGSTATLDDMVRARVLLLPEEARRLLEVVAVAGQPVESEIADRAAGAKEEMNAVSFLRASHLIRVRVTPERQEIEPYHDRIREAMLAQLSPDALRAHHRRLAVALEASGRADPERLALHFREAGDAERAAEHAALAAERTSEALAFDRAAQLYRSALELGAPGGASARRSLSQKMGDALANAGRGAEAAKAYLAAAEGASRAEALELERRAAAQLLRSGHLSEALPLLENITGRIGLTLVQPSWRTLLLFLFQRALIRLRGVSFRERDASQVPAEQLIRLDSFWTLATGLTLVNTARAREFQNRALLLALKTGEPYRVALAIAAEVGYSGTRGWRERDRTDKLLKVATALAEQLGNPYPMGLTRTYASAATLFQGRWRECWNHGETAEAILRERCTGVAWERDLAHIVMLRGLFYLGGIKELALRLPVLIREATERDDLVAVATLRIRQAYLTHLASDEAETARENLRQMVEGWSREGFHNQHYWAMIAGGEIALFEADDEAAWNLLSSQWPGFRRSGLVRFQLYRIEALHLRARAALACATAPGPSAGGEQTYLQAAARDARRIESEGAPWGQALAKLVRSGIAASRRDLDQAVRLLASAEEQLTRLDMALYAAAARRRRGELIGGDEGAALVADADAWMASQAIRNPARMADMLAPGRWS